MTYEQKKRIDHCAACIMMLAFAVVLVLSVSCLVVCLYDPSMGRFCFNLIVASVDKLRRYYLPLFYSF